MSIEFFRSRRRQLALIGVLLIAAVGAPRVLAQNATAPKCVLVFEGNRVFSGAELSAVMEDCIGTKQSQTLAAESFEYCGRHLQSFLNSKGYLQARVESPQRQEDNGRVRWLIQVNEGPLFRLGQIEISGATIVPTSELRRLLDLREGDIADASCINTWLDERMSNVYKNLGYLRFDASLEPIFRLKSNTVEGVIDLKVTIYEGYPFRIKSITFVGLADPSGRSLREQMLVKVGDIFNKSLFDDSLKRISETDQVEAIDPDKDVKFIDAGNSFVEITIQIKRKTS